MSQDTRIVNGNGTEGPNDTEVHNGTDGHNSPEVAAEPPKARLFPSSRLTVSLMMFYGCLVTYILRLNIGIAMVCMIKSAPGDYHNSSSDQGSNDTNTTDYQDCPGSSSAGKHSGDDDAIGEFEWEKSLQGALLGAFFYGYIVTQVPAGWLCDRIGGKIVLGIGLGVVSVLNLLLPVAARFNPYCMLAVRILQGMFAAVSFPAFHNLIGNWAPPTERGLLMALAYSGMYVGSIVNFLLGGLLCKYGFDGGWGSIFYITGLMGVLFVVGLTFLVYDGYETHPRIAIKEKLYLKRTLVGHHEAGKATYTPWLKILTSPPVWAIVAAHLCANWGLYTLVINLPLFMKDVLKFNVKENGFLSALPYLCTLIVNLLCGKLADYIQRRKVCSCTVMRKVFNSIGMFIPALCMLAITFMYCKHRYLAVAALTACQAISGFAYSGGFFYNHVDLSPQHAGILMGLSNMFATVPGILSPLLVGLLTPNGTREEWLVIFYIGTACYIFGGITYLIFGSGERQKWSFTDEDRGSGCDLRQSLPIKHDAESNGRYSEKSSSHL